MQDFAKQCLPQGTVREVREVREVRAILLCPHSTRHYEDQNQRRVGTHLRLVFFEKIITQTLLDCRKKIWIHNQISDAMRMIFIKDIAFEPLTNTIDIDLGNFRTHAPGHL